MADRVIVMHAGRIIETGTPMALYRSPRYRLTAEFFGAGNLLDVTLDGDSAVVPACGLRFALAKSSARPGAQPSAVALIRPEAVKLFVDVNGAGIVTSRQFVGAVVHYQVDIGGTTLRATAVGTVDPLTPGTRVDVRADMPLHLVEDFDSTRTETETPR